MLDDPIVEEIRKNRDKLAAEQDYDIHRLFSKWRKNEKKHCNRLIKNEEDLKQSLSNK
jgi:hypothetical protein